MKNQAIAEAILAGRNIVVLVTGKEVDVGAMKMKLRQIHPSISFGGSQVIQNGLRQTVRIPPSGVEGIRHTLVSVLSQSMLDIQLQPQPNHETAKTFPP